MYLYFALSSYFDTYILHVVLTIMNAMRIKLEIYLCGAVFPPSFVSIALESLFLGR